VQYVIGLISAIAGLLFALHKLQQAGVDLNAFNPFVWWRRKQLEKTYGQKPLYVLDSPMEVAAMLMLATVKCEGEVSREQKRFLLQNYEKEFGLSVGDASALLSQSAYLLRDEEEIASQIDEVLERSRAEFAEQQIESTLELMNQAAEFEDAPNEGQETLIREVRRVLDVRETEGKKWH
jgi:hypothetical protein